MILQFIWQNKYEDEHIAVYHFIVLTKTSLKYICYYLFCIID